MSQNASRAAQKSFGPCLRLRGVLVSLGLSKKILPKNELQRITTNHNKSERIRTNQNELEWLITNKDESERIWTIPIESDRSRKTWCLQCGSVIVVRSRSQILSENTCFCPKISPLTSRTYSKHNMWERNSLQTLCFHRDFAPKTYKVIACVSKLPRKLVLLVRLFRTPWRIDARNLAHPYRTKPPPVK